MKLNRTRLACVLCLAAVPLSAQEQKFTAHFGGGFTAPVRETGTRLDGGWNVGAGAGFNFTQSFGMVGEFMYNSFGINNATLASLDFPGGDSRLWAITLNPVVRFNASGPVGFYVIGGGGVYHRNTEFTQPTVATITVFDPYFGIFYPAAVPANEVLRSFSVTKGGVNIGAGLSFRMGSGGAKVFAESRYHHMFTSNFPTTIVPVTFGVRW